MKEVPGKAQRQHRMILGTHTSGGATDYLQIAHVDIPNPPAATIADYNPSTEELGGYGAAKEPIKFSVVQRIVHPGEVNKARYQPQNPDVIATWASNKNVYVWDRSKHTSSPRDTTHSAPQAVLKGHSDEGFALEWSPHVEGQLLTGSMDNTVMLWDLMRDLTLETKTVAPRATYKLHSAAVNDVQYHKSLGANFFGSVSDDLTMQFVDMRKKPTDKAAVVFENAHTDAINSLAFHPTLDKLFATGSADKTIGVFDLRFPKHRVHSLEGHRDVITKVDWHPTDSAILASSSDDRRVIFWDLSRAGMEQTPEDAEDGCPEMLFMHGGHTNRVSDFSWNLNDPWVMVSAAEDNLIQCWRASRKLVEVLPPGVKRREVSEG